MKNIIFLLLILSVGKIYAQDTISPTNVIRITGKVKQEKSITIDDLKKFKTKELKNVNISCSPKKEERAESVSVVLLKEVLDSVRYEYNSKKELNEFYFLFRAADGYRIVFSFNEIYNTETGNQLYVVTKINGSDISSIENRMLVLSGGDLKPGSRNMKWLESIEVRKAE
jgi:hypothetical protein